MAQAAPPMLRPELLNYRSVDESGNPETGLAAQGIPRRLIAIDNMGLWPTLVALRDGTIIASFFNKPNHERTEGDLECWASSDNGLSWKYRGTPAKHEPNSTRAPGAVGLNREGELVEISPGYDNIRPERNPNSKILKSVISISKDGGETWEVHVNGMPPAVEGLSEHVTFGKIYLAENGDLVAGSFAFDPTEGYKPVKTAVQLDLWAKTQVEAEEKEK